MPRLPTVGFREADFPKAFVLAHSALEGLSRRWVPFGMPRLSPQFKNVAFFLYAKNPKTGELDGPIASGVFVAVPHTSYFFAGHTYAVTCHHCIIMGATVIRVNTNDGKSRFIETEPHEWEFLPHGSDVAAIDLTGRVSQKGDEIGVWPTVQFASKNFIANTQFGLGEDGFMLGLFADHPGKERNMIAARFGNVSVLADEDEPIEQPNGNARPSHLFDMHSRPGSSGSPVFAYRTPAGDLRTAQLRGIDKRREASSQATERYGEVEQNTFLVLLGIHVGQYHDRVVAKKMKAARSEGRDPILDGDHLEVPNSMALVVPAWDVVDLLMIDKFKKCREQREKMEIEQKPNTAKPEVATPPQAAVPAPSTTEGDERHKERFTALLDEAVGKPKRGD